MATIVESILARSYAFVVVSLRYLIVAGWAAAVGLAIMFLPPLSATSSGGLSDSIVDEVTGILVDSHAELVDRLEELLADPVLRDKLVKSGAIPVASSPEEFAKFLKDELDRMGKVIREHGIKEG